MEWYNARARAADVHFYADHLKEQLPKQIIDVTKGQYRVVMDLSPTHVLFPAKTYLPHMVAVNGTWRVYESGEPVIEGDIRVDVMAKNGTCACKNINLADILAPQSEEEIKLRIEEYFDAKIDDPPIQLPDVESTSGLL